MVETLGEVAPSQEVGGSSPSPVPVIDWTNPNCPVSKHFKVGEVITLDRWNRLANLGDGLNDDAKKAILGLLVKADQIREMTGKPMMVHRCFSSQSYNDLIGGAKWSAHVARKFTDTAGVDHFIAAIDFDCSDGSGDIVASCDQIRKTLLPLLESMGLRMEDGTGDNWVHVDTRPPFPGQNRFFKKG